jgi:hypothetical protein
MAASIIYYIIIYLKHHRNLNIENETSVLVRRKIKLGCAVIKVESTFIDPYITKMYNLRSKKQTVQIRWRSYC